MAGDAGVDQRELPCKGLQRGFEVGQRPGDRCIDFGRLAFEIPRVLAGTVGQRAAALDREVGEHETQARKFFGRTERDRQRGHRSVFHADGDGRAVFHLDGVDAGREVGKHGLHGAVDIRQDVVCVYRLGQAAAAHFGRPLATPQHLVIIRVTPPRGLYGAEEGRVGKTFGLQVFEFLQAVAKTVLEDREQRAFGGLLGRGDGIGIGQ